MLKKAGIIAAVAAGGVFALSPLAFAHDHPDVEEATVVSDNQNLECNFENSQNTTGAGGLLGLALGVPINATVPLLSCNNTNVEDIVDAGTTNPNATVADS